jgi:glutaminyl-peptide cyclotransferase
MTRHLLLVVCALLPVAAAPRGSAPAALRSRLFDSERAYRDLVRQCDFGPRVPGTAAHERCGEWLAKELGSRADELSVHRLRAKAGDTWVPLANIAATFNPDGTRHILLCAHWDTRPTADRDPDPAERGKPIIGANDGASGVAVLLEIARALEAQPPKQRVTIVLFDGEDYGPSATDMFLGSRAFAESYAGPPVAWGVLLDMVGDRELRLPYEQYSFDRAPAVVHRIWGAAARAGSEAFVREPGPPVLDDHVFLLRAGIPCIDVIDFDYPHWHTRADTPDKCSADSLNQVGRAILQAIAEDEAS